MANIFSGLFGSQSSNVGNARMAEYNQKLRDYEDNRDAYYQQQAVDAISPGLEEVMAGMTEERKKQVRMQMEMMGQRGMYDKGLEAFNQSFRQRGQTIGDQLKQEKLTEEANARHQYEVDNPQVGDAGAKLEYAIAYIGKDKYEQLTKDGKQDEVRTLMDRAARARQLVDKGTHWEDVVTGETYSKNVGIVERDKKLGTWIGDRLVEYDQNLSERATLAYGFNESIKQLEILQEGANNWTTGFGNFFFKHLPTTDAKNWQNTLETVNAKTVMDAMARLKALSPNGSTGFGAVNLQELMTMQDNWGKLDGFTDDDHMKTVIADRIRIMKDLVKMIDDTSAADEKWYNDNRSYLPPGYQKALPESNVTPNKKGTYNPDTGKVEWQ